MHHFTVNASLTRCTELIPGKLDYQYAIDLMTFRTCLSSYINKVPQVAGHHVDGQHGYIYVRVLVIVINSGVYPIMVAWAQLAPSR